MTMDCNEQLISKYKEQDITIKALRQELEKQTERAGQLYDINEREREVMFQCIHKVRKEGRERILYKIMNSWGNHRLFTNTKLNQTSTALEVGLLKLVIVRGKFSSLTHNSFVFDTLC